MNVEIGAEAALFPEKEYINGIAVAVHHRGPSPCVKPEAQTKRQATQHDCLLSLLSDGDEWIEIVYSEEENILDWADWSSQDRTKISCISTTSPTNQPRNDDSSFYFSYNIQQRPPLFSLYVLNDGGTGKDGALSSDGKESGLLYLTYSASFWICYYCTIHFYFILQCASVFRTVYCKHKYKKEINCISERQVKLVNKLCRLHCLNSVAHKKFRFLWFL
jgi:hypothetical protein